MCNNSRHTLYMERVDDSGYCYVSVRVSTLYFGKGFGRDRSLGPSEGGWIFSRMSGNTLLAFSMMVELVWARWIRSSGVSFGGTSSVLHTWLGWMGGVGDMELGHYREIKGYR